MKERHILKIINKIKKLDYAKLELVEKATDSCIVVQNLEEIDKKSV